MRLHLCLKLHTTCPSIPTPRCARPHHLKVTGTHTTTSRQPAHAVFGMHVLNANDLLKHRPLDTYSLQKQASTRCALRRLLGWHLLECLHVGIGGLGNRANAEHELREQPHPSHEQLCHRNRAVAGEYVEHLRSRAHANTTSSPHCNAVSLAERGFIRAASTSLGRSYRQHHLPPPPAHTYSCSCYYNQFPAVTQTRKRAIHRYSQPTLSPTHPHAEKAHTHTRLKAPCLLAML